MIERDCQVWLDNILNKVEGNIAISNAAKQPGGKKRHSYTAKFKAEAIHACEEGDISQEKVSKTFRINQAMLSRWISNKSEIFKDASKQHRKLLKKGRKATKYVVLHKKNSGKNLNWPDQKKAGEFSLGLEQSTKDTKHLIQILLSNIT